MTQEHVYLDYNATAPLREEAREAMTDALALFGNPSSVHAEGRKARAAVERARAQVAALAGCEPGEVVFTGSGTEANNTALRQPAWDRLLVSGVEHDSVLAAARAAERPVELIPVLEDGRVDTIWMRERCEALAADGEKVLVCVQVANNETGVIQPLQEVSAIAREHGFALHADAVQAAGRLPIDFAGSGAWSMALSAHKIGGPKGLGALILRRGARIRPLIHGGGQETNQRAGTENVAGIIGFGAGAAASGPEETDRIRRLRDSLEDGIRALTPGATVIGESSERLPNTSCIAHPDFKAETLVIALDLAGVAVSAGAACSSGKVAESHVLKAMGLAEETVNNAIRVSAGWATTAAQIDRFLEAWRQVAESRLAQASVA